MEIGVEFLWSKLSGGNRQAHILLVGGVAFAGQPALISMPSVSK